MLRLLEPAPSSRFCSPRTSWAITLTVWMALIGFSSTSQAGSWCEQVFHAVSAWAMQQFRFAFVGSDLVHFLAHKNVHVGLFASFAVLLWQALPNSRCKFGYILLAGTVLGSGSEFLQRFFPGRDPALRDVCINAAATACGAVVSWTVFRSNRKSTRNFA